MREADEVGILHNNGKTIYRVVCPNCSGKHLTTVPITPQPHWRCAKCLREELNLAQTFIARARAESELIEIPADDGGSPKYKLLIPYWFLKDEGR